jgi:glycosyltransferase involved in cell wall biosynthesis
MTPATQPATPPTLPWAGAFPGQNTGTRNGLLLSVLMPVFNERRTLRAIVRRVLASETPIPLELVIVDDGSPDGSAEIVRELAAQDPRVRAVFHDRNQGKGAAGGGR